MTLIFQPAEEGGGGGARMCDDGALEGDGGGGIGPKVTKIYGLHNWPGMPLGTIATKAGPLLAATDEFNVTIKGTQGHAAFPHMTADPVTAVCHTVGALQTIASRNTPPTDPMVLSVTQVHSGFTHNVIPSEAMLGGTLRTVTDETRKMARERFYEIVRTQASSFGCEAEIDWHEGYPVTHNNAALADHVLETAHDAGRDRGPAAHRALPGRRGLRLLRRARAGVFLRARRVPRGRDEPGPAAPAALRFQRRRDPAWHRDVRPARAGVMRTEGDPTETANER